MEKCKKDIVETKQETENLKQTAKNDEIEIQDLTSKKANLHSALASSKSIAAFLQGEEEAIKKTAEVGRIENEAIAYSCDELKAKIQELNEIMTRAQNRDKNKFELRKDRHNYMQELKGNIRVYCRVRPRLPGEVGGKEVVQILSEQVVDIVLPNQTTGAGVSSSKSMKAERFNLDKVFGTTITQDEIFSEVSSFVKSVLDGYNVCIFAYGQTGTGKTYTMEGKLSDAHSYGIIPRSVGQIFSAIKDLAKWGWEYTLEVSIQEIYNEKLIDLLCRDNNISQNTGMD